MAIIPQFPGFRPVSLEDRHSLEGLFREMQPEVSELNFTNLFMFQHVHDYRLSTLNGNVVILAKSYTGEPYFLPPIGGDMIPETVKAMMDFMRGRGDRPLIDLAWKGFIDRYVAGGEEYRHALDEDNSDYLYKAKDLIRLSGRKYHDKKNLRNQFLRKYSHEYRRLTPELAQQAKDLVERWCQEKCSVEVPSTYGETEATMRTLDNLEHLSVIGGVVLIDGVVQALSLGEELNPRTVVVHVEKANSEYAGLYQYISSEFLAREFAGYDYVNREQDLGEPNLRKSKLSYNPVGMVEKYRVWPKE